MISIASRNDAILDIFLTKIRNEYVNDVALVCCYGSAVSGDTHTKSDIDFYYVPRTPRARELTKVFILDGIGYDFWGISWEQLERMASFDDTFVSLVAEAKVVYSAGQEFEDRFDALKQKVGGIISQPTTLKMLDRAKKHFDLAKTRYADLLLADNVGTSRLAAGRVLLALADALCLANNRYFRFGIKKHLAELTALSELPNQFEAKYTAVIKAQTSGEIIDACADLLKAVKEFFDQHSSPGNPHDLLPEWYEEACSAWNKIYFACDSGNANLAYLAGVCLQHEINEICRRCGLEQTEFEFLSSFQANRLPEYGSAAREAEERFVSLLSQLDVPVVRYDSVDALRQDVLGS